MSSTGVTSTTSRPTGFDRLRHLWMLGILGVAMVATMAWAAALVYGFFALVLRIFL